ncbi:MAG: S-layer protein [Candidatus Aenigmarchaeota archaeon]|nr:S-layer protein [Candidatus Aenigmarchaeota archaeon]
MQKILSKIGAGLIGAVMTGATLLAPAMAADLSEYPAPFITDGTTDMLMVVGADASPADVVGAINVAVRLGAEPGETKTVTTAGAATTTMTGESADLASGADRIYLLDELADGGVTQMTVDDLPTILAEGTFEDDGGTEYDYSQKIEIGATDHAEFIFDDSGADLDDPVLIIDLGTATGTPIYDLVVDFDEATPINASDSVGEKITLFGKDYTVGSSTDNDELQLLGGALDVAFEDTGEVKTGTFNEKDYEITLTGVTSAEKASIKITYDGVTETKTVAEGSTKTIAGLEIYADTVNYYGLESKLGDAVISLGADEIWLKDGDEVKVGSSKTGIEGTLVDLTPDATLGVLTQIKIRVTADDNERDHLAIGDSFVDPVFGTVKVTFADVKNGPDLSESESDSDTSRRKIEVLKESSAALGVKLTDERGETATLPFAYDHGDDTDDMIVADEKGEVVAMWEGANIDDDESYLILNSNGEYVTMGQIKTVNNADCDVLDLTIKDVFTGDYIIDWDDKDTDPTAQDFTYKGKTFTVTCNDSADTLTIADKTTGSVAVYPFIELYHGYDQRVAFTEDVTVTGLTADTTIVLPTGSVAYVAATNNVTIATVEYDSAAGVVTALVGQVYYTFNGSTNNELDIAVDANQNGTASAETHAGLLIVEEEDATNSDAKEAVIIGTDDDGVSDKMQVEAPWFSDAEAVSQSFDDTDLTGYVDTFGTYILLNTDGDQDVLTITIPKEQMYADVYVSEITSEVSTAGGEGAVTYEQVVPIKDNIARLDTDAEVESAKGNKNMIIIGGPAVNRLTAAVLGLSYPTYGVDSTVPENAAMVKIVENAFGGGKVAYVVAGWEAANTGAACSVLQQYDTHALTGTGVKVSGTATPFEVTALE